MTKESMSRMRVGGRALMGAAALVLAAAANAGPLVQFFSGTGQVAPTGNPAPNDGLEVAVVASTYDFALSNPVSFGNVWGLKSLFNVDGLALGQPGNSRGSGSFFDTNSSDSILFDFTGQLFGFDQNAGEFFYQLTYDVTGGTGRFAGADGTGFENLYINPNGFTFRGAGGLTLTYPMTSVPEPSTLALAALAVMAVLLRRPRRAHELSPASPAAA